MKSSSSPSWNPYQAQEYYEKFGERVPPLVGKFFADHWDVDSLHSRLKEAIETNEPVTDWQGFVKEHFERYGQEEEERQSRATS